MIFTNSIITINPDELVQIFTKCKGVSVLLIG